MARVGITAAVLAVALLAGCNQGSDEAGRREDSASVAPLPGGDGYPVVDGGAAIGTNVVADFRRRFPDLADGRSDASIADGGARICNLVVEPGTTRASLADRLPEVFGSQPGNDYQDGVLLRLFVYGMCAERVPELQALIGDGG